LDTKKVGDHQLHADSYQATLGSLSFPILMSKSLR
jgi:hypothetical protein